MNIGIVGLGLIGGSLAKAFRQYTDHTVWGLDTNVSVVLQAKLFDSIHAELTDENIGQCDIVFAALYPSATVRFIKEKAELFKKNAVVMDCCGVKRAVCDELFPFTRNRDFLFVGGHPMAGREAWGFDGAKAGLFKDATFILTPGKSISIECLQMLKEVLGSIGFTRLQVSTPEEHDRIIACTSQLAHIVSGAYVKSPTAEDFRGFSAGSFRDMTRVAKLNATMWTELFFDNKEYLSDEINGLIERLGQYRDALQNDDRETMRTLLEEGSRIKCSIR